MKGWRTVMFNILGMATLAATSEYAAVIPPKAQPYVALGITVGNIVLRTVTTTPIGQSTPK